MQKELGITYEALYSELVSLTPDHYITLDPRKINKLILTKEGKEYADEGTPEAKIYNMASVEGTPKEVIEKELGAAYKFGFGNAKAKKIVDLKDNKIFRAKENFVDEDQLMLKAIENGNAEIENK